MNEQRAPRGWLVRLTVLGLFTCLAGAGLADRLYDLQVHQVDRYRARVQRLTSWDNATAPVRGRIFDREGRMLITNTPRYELAVMPDADPNDVRPGLDAVATVLNLNAATLWQRIQPRLAAHIADPIVVAYSLSPPQLAHVAPVLPTLPGFRLVTQATRRYLYGNAACHVLGYVGEVSEGELSHVKDGQVAPGDLIGKSGLEKSYDRVLRGIKGTQHVAVDAGGSVLGVLSDRPPISGGSLHLTLDMKLQEVAERSLTRTLQEVAKRNGGERSGGAVVLMGVKGNVLAMVSLPGFNPSEFARGITDKEYLALLRDPLNPLFDRVTDSAVPPGSTFKQVTSMAAMQEGLCTPTTTFYCSGNYKGFNCFERSGHGSISFTETIAQSCDVTYYRLGDMLGINRLTKYARAFGLGSPTGIDLPDESGGLWPTPSWKQKALHEEWFEGETIIQSIGQGYLQVTPLQMAVVTATVANGGYVYAPYLVQRIGRAITDDTVWNNVPKPKRRIPVKAEYLAALRVGMAGTVTHGTATAALSPIVSIGGKTGTAENSPTATNPHGRNHTWFVSFAPVQHPKVVCVVFVEKAGGYGGGVAAPVAREVLEAWARDH